MTSAPARHHLPHTPVMCDEVMRYLSPQDGEIYVDGTFGAGGYTSAMLRAAKCTAYALDCDPYVEDFVNALKQEFGKRFHFIQGQFGDMVSLLRAEGVEKVDGVVLDIGVSSMQIDTPRRGFSFSEDGPLDMRMSCDGRDASELINSASEEELAGIIFTYGGEKKSRRIARAIVTARATQHITRTGELAGIIRDAVKGYNDNIDPATRTFQAIRIWVNQELDELERGLQSAEELLKPEGRLVVVSFHSGEDSIVKRFLNTRAGKKPGIPRYLPLLPENQQAPSFRLLTRKAVQPSPEEIKRNPRARSAKLRAVARTEAPIWGKEA